MFKVRNSWDILRICANVDIFCCKKFWLTFFFLNCCIRQYLLLLLLFLFVVAVVVMLPLLVLSVCCLKYVYKYYILSVLSFIISICTCNLGFFKPKLKTWLSDIFLADLTKTLPSCKLVDIALTNYFIILCFFF